MERILQKEYFNQLKILKTRFSYKDIMEAAPDLKYEQLVHLVERWISDGLITPILKSGKTSFHPSIYHEYKKLPVKQDYCMYTEEIKTLHPRLNIGRYLKHPEKYAEHRQQIVKLSEYFWDTKSLAHDKMSINEKSFIIWGDEKFLSSAKGHNLLIYNQLKVDDLNYYTTPEPFFISICNRDFKNKSVLIIENKDPWYSLAKAFKIAECSSIYGIEFGLIVYGEGNKATREGALTEFLNDYVELDVDIYYIGDIDAAGIDMLDRVIEKNKKLRIRPLVQIYKEMLKKSEGREMNKTEDHREKSINMNFLEWFTDCEQERILNIIAAGKRIPQEILSYPDYMTLCCDSKI